MKEFLEIIRQHARGYYKHLAKHILYGTTNIQLKSEDFESRIAALEAGGGGECVNPAILNSTNTNSNNLIKSDFFDTSSNGIFYTSLKKITSYTGTHSTNRSYRTTLDASLDSSLVTLNGKLYLKNLNFGNNIITTNRSYRTTLDAVSSLNVTTLNGKLYLTF